MVSFLRRRQKRFISPVQRYIVFFFNFFCWVIAIGLTALTAWVLKQKDKKVRDAGDFFLDPACILCLLGSVAIVLAYLGFVGSLRLNTLLLKLYYWPLSLFVLVQVIFAIFLFVCYYAPDVIKSLNIFPEEVLNDAILKYQSDDDVVDLIDNIQRELECCGISNDDQGFKDWSKNMYFNCSSDNQSPLRCSVPPSCCILKPGDSINLLCGKDAINQTTDELKGIINVNGCFKGLGVWIEGHAVILGGCLLGILLPQIVLIWMSKGLVSDYKTEKDAADRRKQDEQIAARQASAQPDH